MSDDKNLSLEWAQQFQDAHDQLIAEMFGVFDATRPRQPSTLTLDALEEAVGLLTCVYDSAKDETGLYFIWVNDVPVQVTRIYRYGDDKLKLTLKNGDEVEMTDEVKVCRVNKASYPLADTIPLEFDDAPEVRWNWKFRR